MKHFTPRKRALILLVIGTIALLGDVVICKNYSQILASIRAAQYEITPLEDLRVSLLKQTPLGSDARDVYRFVESQGLYPELTGHSVGDHDFSTGFGFYRLTSHYRLTYVGGHWSFDSSNRLNNIVVFKQEGVPFWIPKKGAYRITISPKNKKRPATSRRAFS